MTELSKSAKRQKEKTIKQFFQTGEKLTPELLLKYGFVYKNEDYIKVVHDENSDEEYYTLRLFQKGDYFIAYINSIKLYTLNDLKMLWHLHTREELLEKE